MRTVNLGIVAHVDAGKTSLTERLLYEAGVIEAPGSVDAGTTQTDTLALERERGITIKSAVVSFDVDGVTVNLIDTPGHPDFIAEVERVLRVLDGAILVVSAVEGVQPQSRLLVRALRRLGIPTLVFVNKIDRPGARAGELLEEIAARLTPAVMAMGAAAGLGTRNAAFVPAAPGDPAYGDALVELLLDRAPALAAAHLDDPTPASLGRLWRELARRARRGEVHPVYLGSALTGAGVDALRHAIVRLLPVRSGRDDGPVDGVVFKVERGPARERIAYVRLFSGTLLVRDRVPCGAVGEATVTAIDVFDRGGAARMDSLAAGRIARVRGLGGVRIGDRIGASAATGAGAGAYTGSGTDAGAGRGAAVFAPPTLEAVVVPRRPGDRPALHRALAELAEQDPLIRLRPDPLGGDPAISLYGEVQQQVLAATLAADHGIEVEFRAARPICVERPLGPGAALTRRFQRGNPFAATVGLRIEPAAAGSGVRIVSEVEVGSVPAAIQKAVDDAVAATLHQGAWGWQVTDCLVTVTHCDHRPPPVPAGEFRKLTPLVVAAALRRAGTVVCEPILRYRLELPDAALAGTLAALGRLRAVPTGPARAGRDGDGDQGGAGDWVVEGEIAADRVGELRRQVPGLTGGLGLLDVAFDSYRPVAGRPPSRPRSERNPFDRDEYLLHVAGRL